MQSFTYDPAKSFRGWLKTLTHHAWFDWLESQRRGGAGSGDAEVLRRLETVEARDDLVQQLAKAFDAELLEEALARVRLRVAPHTWEAFHLLALEGWSGAQAAEKLHMKVANVFVAKSNVQKMLQETIQALDPPDAQ